MTAGLGAWEHTGTTTLTAAFSKEKESSDSPGSFSNAFSTHFLMLALVMSPGSFSNAFSAHFLMLALVMSRAHFLTLSLIIF
jgi:hypothetical protein